MTTMSITPGRTHDPNIPPSPSQYIGSMTPGSAVRTVVTAADRSPPTFRDGKRRATSRPSGIEAAGVVVSKP